MNVVLRLVKSLSRPPEQHEVAQRELAWRCTVGDDPAGACHHGVERGAVAGRQLNGPGGPRDRHGDHRKHRRRHRSEPRPGSGACRRPAGARRPARPRRRARPRTIRVDERITPVALDITDRAAIGQLATSASDTDLLISNAGAAAFAPALDADPDGLAREFAVNFTGLYDMVRAFTPARTAAAAPEES